ncbi:MAG: KpsF/GutQ family sugar-phosphate isomerase [Pseudomonadota bacterium]
MSTEQTPLEIAQRVLRIEGAAVSGLADAMPSDFAAVVDAILATKGRVVLSGIGKSGLVARKISSTFASTGTPSTFVHPAEASHGDLGMITDGDLVILVSNSGETAELRDVIAHVARFSIPMVGVSGVAESTLMQAARYELLIPPVEEACIYGLAPTTSTTLTMALGDALAMSAMELRGFNADAFQALHPGGRIGARLARVGQLMHGQDELPLVPEDTPMPEALIVMTEKSFGVTGVTRDGLLVGVVTDGDLRRNVDRLTTSTAGEVASRPPLVIGASELAAEALALMSNRKITALFVTDDAMRPLGLIHLHDCLRAGIA